MPATEVGPKYGVSDGLALAYADSAAVQRLKNRAFRLLSASRSWDSVIRRSAKPADVIDSRPATMMHEVKFDYSATGDAQYVEFVEADEDDCNISW